MALSAEDSQIAHLLRRAGFGASPAEWEAYSRLGLAGATDVLLHPERAEDTMGRMQREIGGDFVDFEDFNSIRNWWLYRMTHSPRPLEEKMTLFWHNHFATAAYKVYDAKRMWHQNETFRRFGLGSFRTLLQQVARDPAMLIWLDGAQNHAGAPNENFAREVMELFTLGRGGGYTETDVKEAARSFTGWRGANTPSGFLYEPGLHDDGEKTVLGETGNWHADDMVDILARHPSTAKRITTKLYSFFVGGEPSDADSKRLTDAYFASDYDIRSVLQALFTSEAFLAPAARFAKIKSPTEFTVMTLKTLGAPMTSAREASGALALMGQDLFNPPNVKGWNEGRDWINSRTLLARVNFASRLTEEMSRRVSLLDTLRGLASPATSAANAAPTAPMMGAAPSMTGATMSTMGAAPSMTGAAPSMTGATAPTMSATGGMAGATGRSGAATPDEAIDLLWNALFRGMEMPAATRALLLQYANGDKPEKQLPTGKVQGLINLMVSLPEYQLC